MTTASKVTLGDELRSLQSGVAANLTDDHTMNIGGVAYTPSELKVKIQEFIDVQTKTIDAKNAFHTFVGNEKVSNAAARTFRNQVHGCLVARYGKDNAILTQFGFQPAKPKKTTVATKAVAALKVKATRTARNTMGKKARLKIKGTVDPSVIEAVAGHANPAPAPTPEPAPVSPATPAQPGNAHPASAPVASSSPGTGGATPPATGHSG